MALPHFDPADVTRAVNDTLTVRRVFGEAYEREGLLVVRPRLVGVPLRLRHLHQEGKDKDGA